jgi:DNA-binding transcriptional LysR family regulator
MLDYKIRSFLAVIEQGTLQKASESLGLTQPAVSQHLKALEQEWQVPFFNHVGRRLVLNDAGEMLRRAAEQSELISMKLRTELSGLIDGKKFYRLGATLTIGEFILPSYIGEYRQKHPEVDLSIRIENTVSVLKLLDRGEIDLALVEGPFNSERYESKLFLRDEMVFIGTNENVNPGCTEIGEDELISSRLILREPGSGTRFFWEEYLNRRGIKLPSSSVIMEVGSLSAIKSLVESGYGCSVMSSRAVQKELLIGAFKTWPFTFGPLIRNMYFVYNKESPAGFLSDFIDFISGLNS